MWLEATVVDSMGLETEMLAGGQNPGTPGRLDPGGGADRIGHDGHYGHPAGGAADGVLLPDGGG